MSTRGPETQTERGVGFLLSASRKIGLLNWSPFPLIASAWNMTIVQVCRWTQWTQSTICPYAAGCPQKVCPNMFSRKSDPAACTAKRLIIERLNEPSLRRVDAGTIYHPTCRPTCRTETLPFSWEDKLKCLHLRMFRSVAHKVRWPSTEISDNLEEQGLNKFAAMTKPNLIQFISVLCCNSNPFPMIQE